MPMPTPMATMRGFPCFEKTHGSAEAGAAEPAEHFLGAMGKEDDAEQEAGNGQSEFVFRSKYVDPEFLSRLLDRCPGGFGNWLAERDRLAKIRRAVGIPFEQLGPGRALIAAALMRFGIGMVKDPVLTPVRRNEKGVMPR
jgi:hypothetical protein